MNIEKCPYCQSERIVYLFGLKPPYHCRDCGEYFDDDTVRWEELRHKMSWICSDVYATEEHPLALENVYLDLENKGLIRPQDMCQITSVFMDYEGIIWFTSPQFDSPTEFDHMQESHLQRILEAMWNAHDEQK